MPLYKIVRRMEPMGLGDEAPPPVTVARGLTQPQARQRVLQPEPGSGAWVFYTDKIEPHTEEDDEIHARGGVKGIVEEHRRARARRWRRPL